MRFHTQPKEAWKHQPSSALSTPFLSQENKSFMENPYIAPDLQPPLKLSKCQNFNIDFNGWKISNRKKGWSRAPTPHSCIQTSSKVTIDRWGSSIHKNSCTQERTSPTKIREQIIKGLSKTIIKLHSSESLFFSWQFPITIYQKSGFNIYCHQQKSILFSNDTNKICLIITRNLFWNNTELIAEMVTLTEVFGN